MFINEQNTMQWMQMIKENLGVTDQVKANWMAEYAARHELKESLIGVNGTAAQPAAAPNMPGQVGVGPIYTTPLNTLGMGNPTAPSPLSTTQVSTADFFNQRVGSGDIPVSTLPMSLNIALTTVGFELFPVVPAKGPWTMVSYMDFPYAGGKMGGKGLIAGIDGIGEGRENKPIYFKVLLPATAVASLRKELKANAPVEFKSANGVAKGYFKQFGLMDGGLIVEVESVKDGDGDDAANTSLKAVFAEGLTEMVGATVEQADLAKARVDFVQTQVDLVDGFANFATGAKAPMTRAQNETGTGNSIGLRMFTKWVQCGSYEVTGEVTRQQLQDLPLYGVDAVSTIMEAMQNEISQHINRRLIDEGWKLGVTNAVKLRHIQGVDFNLYMGTAPSCDLADFGISEFADVDGEDWAAAWGAVQNSEVNTSAENLATRQRRISSRILAAANLIAVSGRRGRATWVLTNAQVATALQDVSGYVVAPMANTMSQTSQSIYHAGTVAGLQVFVDPYMTWDDCRVLLGRKGNGKEPGLVFMPYLLADTVSITAEGTMAPKMLINSRFAIVPIGFFPESQYYAFAVKSDFGLI